MSAELQKPSDLVQASSFASLTEVSERVLHQAADNAAR